MKELFRTESLGVRYVGIHNTHRDCNQYSLDYNNSTYSGCTKNVIVVESVTLVEGGGGSLRGGGCTKNVILVEGVKGGGSTTLLDNEVHC